MNTKTKCNKCDERGYIADTEYSRHSCECGWAIEQSFFKLKDFTLEDLLAYGRQRAVEKGKK